MVKGISYKILNPFGDHGLVEECISDVFFSAWNNISKFKGDEDKFKSWICSIARFKAIDYYRKHSKSLGNKELDDSYLGISSFEDEVIETLEQGEIMNHILNFEEPDKSIFIMKFLLGLSSKSIAEKLSISINAIDSRVFRGKKRLKEAFLNKEKEVI